MSKNSHHKPEITHYTSNVESLWAALPVITRICLIRSVASPYPDIAAGDGDVTKAIICRCLVVLHPCAYNGRVPGL